MFTSDSWNEAGLPGSRGGTFGCFPLAGVALGGFAKPRGSRVVRMEDHPVAALEKIASDLAFDLGLPVPPAVLWEREGPRSHGRQLIISAAPFDGALTWLQVEAAPSSVAARILPSLAPSASAISAFDTWLPTRFLLPQDRDEILNALLYRQPRLRGIVKKSHPGLP